MNETDRTPLASLTVAEKVCNSPITSSEDGEIITIVGGVVSLFPPGGRANGVGVFEVAIALIWCPCGSSEPSERRR